MESSKLAERIITSLKLDLPPVALTFVNEAPDGVPAPPREVPSACSFWRDAEQGTFYASAVQHHNCPIGAMVMGFSLPAEIQQRLGELVTGMCEQNYIDEKEAASIPTVNRQHIGIVYGPLAESSNSPSVVLLWVTARQAMLCNEAVGAANWTTPSPVLTGRPGCATLPVAMADATPALSLGCAGMRTFTGIGEDRMLLAVPGSELESFVDAIEKAVGTNALMLDYYREQRGKFPVGAA